MGERFNPFPGLRVFEPHEDHLFFGRERETDELLQRLRTTRFLPVIGASGSGKSSLVRSGLIPSLHSGFMVDAGSSWRIAILRPGEDPMGRLAEALNDPGVLGGDPQLPDTNRTILEATLRGSSMGLAEAVRFAGLPPHDNVLVVVDQFEELFRFKRGRKATDHGDEAVAFVKLLLEAAKQKDVPVFIVLTMRSDFIGDCTEFPGLTEAINLSQYLVPRMTRDELRAAITGPVAVGGGAITPRLVVRLLNDVGDDDQLPVLQHALMRTWDYWEQSRREDEPLDLRHYETVGGMKSALSMHAEEVYQELLGKARERSARERPTGIFAGRRMRRAMQEAGEEVKRVTSKLFKALTDLTDDNRGVRRPTALGELGEIVDVEQQRLVEVIEAFRAPGRTFLMPPASVPLESASIVDISHESLMRVWGRLKEWAQEERKSAEFYQRLARSAGWHEQRIGRWWWQRAERLWRNPVLQLAKRWRREQRPNHAWARRYDPQFQRSMEFLDKSLGFRRARRLAALLLVIGAIGFVLNWQRGTIEKQARAIVTLEGKVEQLERREPPVVPRPVEEEREVEPEPPDIEALRAQNASLQAELVDTIDGVRATLAELAGVHREIERHALRARGLRSDQESLLVQAEGLGVPWQPTPIPAVDVSIAAPDEELPEPFARIDVSGLADEELAELNDRLAGERDAMAARLSQLEGSLRRAQRVRDDLARAVRSLEADNASLGRTLADPPRDWRGIAETLAVSTEGLESNPVLAALLSLEAFRLYEDHVGDPDTAPAIFAALQRSARWLAPEPRVLHHPEEVRAVAWSPDGRTLATGAHDGRLRLYDLRSPDRPPRVRDPDPDATMGLLSVAFSRDGAQLAVGGDGLLLSLGRHEPTLTILETSTLRELRRIPLSGPDAVEALAYTADGKKLLVGRAGQGVFAYDTTTWERTELSMGGRSARVFRLATSPDGSIAAATRKGDALVWDGTRLQQPPRVVCEGEIFSVAFSADGKIFACGDMRGGVRTWDAADAMRPLDRLECRDRRVPINDLRFGPHGLRLAAAGSNGELWVWSRRGNGWECTTPGRHEGPIWKLDWDPYGGRLVSVGGDARARIWRVWRTRSTQLARELCADVPRGLTRPEWEEHVPRVPYGEHRGCASRAAGSETGGGQ